MYRIQVQTVHYGNNGKIHIKEGKISVIMQKNNTAVIKLELSLCRQAVYGHAGKKIHNNGWSVLSSCLH